MPALVQWADLDKLHLSILNYVRLNPGTHPDDLRASSCHATPCRECGRRVRDLIVGGFARVETSEAGLWPMPGLYLTRSGVDGLARHHEPVSGLRLAAP